MRILILGSVALPVPPPLQGGTERIAYEQARGLAAKGHMVTLVAARGSEKNSAYALVEIGGGDTVSLEGSHPSRLTESSRKLRKEMVYLAQVADWLLTHGKDFDLILNNMRGGESLFLPVAKTISIPLVNVMHLPIFPELAELFRHYEAPIITISNAQQKVAPDLNYRGTVYNGIDPTAYPLSRQQGSYLLMMGSIVSHKNQKDGIAAARGAKLPLIIAGKIGNQEYYEDHVHPFEDGKTVIVKGEMGFAEKVTLFQGAKALLFPVLWEEPFGLVMIEALSCGTPVIAYPHGAVPEVIVSGKNGFLVNSVEEMAEKIAMVAKIDRRACRHTVEEKFTIDHMIAALEKSLLQVL